MNLFDFNEAFSVHDKTIKNGLSARKLKIRTKIKFEDRTKKENVAKVLEELPCDGESLHIVSNGSFAYFTLIPRILELAENPAEAFHFATWTMSHQNVANIVDLFDRGLFKKVSALTGEYFRQREHIVYSFLVTELEKRGQRVFSNKNHAKVSLLAIGDDRYVIEGSANFTANPRIEQFSIINHGGLYEFHLEWMEKLLKHGEKYIGKDG